MTMKRTQSILTIEIAAFVVAALIVVGLFESNTLLEGSLADSKTNEFLVVTAMELLTLCTVPLALRLFKFKSVERSLKENGQQALLKWGTIRIMLIVVPMLLNVILFYLFGNVAFGYMAIILFLCLFFIYPTKSRCEAETEP